MPLSAYDQQFGFSSPDTIGAGGGLVDRFVRGTGRLHLYLARALAEEAQASGLSQRL